MVHWFQQKPTLCIQSLAAPVREGKSESSRPTRPTQSIAAERDALVRRRRLAFDTIGREIVIVKARHAQRMEELRALESAVAEIRHCLSEEDSSPQAFVRLHAHLCERLGRVRATGEALQAKQTDLENRLRSEIADTYRRLEVLEDNLRDGAEFSLERSVA